MKYNFLGDFNVNMLNFESHGLTNDYINGLISKSFTPVINLPTRVKHQSATLLDHIWTNKMCNTYNAGIIIDSLSDHFPVFYIEEGGQDEKQQTKFIYKRNINSKSIPAFCKLLKSASWEKVITEKSPALAFSNFFEIINCSRDIAFPEIKIKQKPIKLKTSPWMTSGLIISQKRKSKLFAKKARKPTKYRIIQNIQ